ncbi:hypothetical protein DL763_010831 [Monosporascus cannonballus]|nr:hypothetical protein DL763_010831 [Monosporascus cannonballus]
MPFIPGTPESRMGRTDSKNPEPTCRGITSSGRPCRRPLNASSNGPHVSRKRADRLAVDDPANPDLYCHQHKDQADASARSSPGPKTSNTPILEGRESLDTLIDRLGIVEAQQKSHHRRKKTHRSSDHHGDGGRHEEKTSEVKNTYVSEVPQKPRPTTTRKSFLCCCFSIPFGEDEQEEEDHARPARPKPRPVQSAPADAAAAAAAARPPSSSQHLTPGPRPGLAASKHSSAQSGNSQTSELMSLISAQTAPQTASQLLAELAKPPSAQDEPGYIYIFWLTPESAAGKPPTDAARSLLAPPSKSSDARQRRPSDALERYAAENSSSKPRSRSGGKDRDGKHDKNGGGGGGGGKKTILLKIGRASNVQRRLNEWQRQCGYDIDLIRYYPYVPSQSEQDTPRKMPHSHKVERLVHIELAGLGLRASDRGETCAACGRAHREWFEVEASRRGVQVVDEVVRRWSDWDEGRGGGK